jgi:hypothetical protein
LTEFRELLFIDGSITGLADRANSKRNPDSCWGADEFLHLTGKREKRDFPSSRRMIPREITERVLRMTRDWKYDAVSFGFPGGLFTANRRANRQNSAEVGSDSVLKIFSKAG